MTNQLPAARLMPCPFCNKSRNALRLPGILPKKHSGKGGTYDTPHPTRCPAPLASLRKYHASGRPRNNYDLTPENVMAHMTFGLTYQVRQIALKFHRDIREVRPVLELLVKDGLIERAFEGASNRGFRRGPAPEPKLPVTLNISIATKMIRVQFERPMNGYDAEMARNRDLCMRARGTR